MKKCSKCKQLKPYSDYTVAVDKKDGCQSYCKPCKSSHDRRYYKTYPAKKNLQMRLYRERNKQTGDKAA